MDLSFFEIAVACLVALLGAALKILWGRTENLGRGVSTIETRLAVLNEQKTNIFHRLERMDEKLDRILQKQGGK